MQGSTLCILNEQWGRAMLDGDFQTVDRIDSTRAKIETLGAPAVCVDHCPTVTPSALLHVAHVLPKGCKWAGSDECRMCVAPESGKCPEIHIGAAA